VVRDRNRDRDGGIVMVIVVVRTGIAALGWFHGEYNRKIRQTYEQRALAIHS
jgi:hypothetical protein